MWKGWPRFRAKTRPAVQLLLPFSERRRRLERIFRRAIVAITLLGLAGIWLAMPDGRAALVSKVRRAKWSTLRGIGLEPDRAEVDAYWADRRGRREIRTRQDFRERFATLTPDQKSLLRASGMGPDDAVIRWGNYDMTFVLASKVFDRDDDGRYYRLRPNTRSLLLKQMHILGLETCQFYLPDTPEIRTLATRTGLDIMENWAQSTNSWGCRGPEPDLNAAVRVLVLGDSFMQGFLLADDETPPMCLERTLKKELGGPTSVLNTGVLGYGPEHYYNTLRAYCDRFRPHLVVVAVFANDFGDEKDVYEGGGDWSEGKYWLDQILWYCLSRNVYCLISPVPSERQINQTRRVGNYSAELANITEVLSEFFCDPTDEFVAEDLRINAREKRESRFTGSGLYNGALADQHLSPRGAELWGQIVGRRIAAILESRKKPAKPRPTAR
jgi:hypothetical protein